MNTSAKDKLTVLLNDESSVQDILDTADELMGEPIIFIDLKYKLLAHSKGRADDDPLWAELINAGRFSHKTVDFFKHAKFIEAYNSSPVSLMQHPELRDRINGIVYDNNGVQIGSICAVAYNKPFTEEDYQIIEAVCDKLTYAAENIDIKNRILELSEEDVLIELIEGKTDLSAEQTKLLMGLSKQLKENIYVAVVDIIKYEHTITHLAYFADLFKRLKSDFLYFTYLNNIVVLLSSDRAVLNFEKEMKELNDFFIDYNIFAGVSSKMNDLKNLKKYFKEALNALNYGTSLNSGKHILNYDIFKSELFLNLHLEDIDITHLCHTIFFHILNYDKRKKTNYLEFLNVYFLNGLNTAIVANKLNISLKKVESTVQNITKLFEVDFTDGNLLFSLFRSIKIYKCFSERF